MKQAKTAGGGNELVRKDSTSVEEPAPSADSTALADLSIRILNKGGLSQFWDCLEKQPREALLTIQKQSLLDTVHCDGCAELLQAAIKSLDDDAAGKQREDSNNHDAAEMTKESMRSIHKGVRKSQRPPPGMMLLRRSDSGTFSSELMDEQNEEVDDGQDFVLYTGPVAGPAGSAGQFKVLQGAFLQRAIEEIEQTAAWALSEALSSGGAPVRAPPAACPYCADKYNVRFVDMLTYPRPVRKFRLLLDCMMPLGTLRDMMAAETGVESTAMLVLLLRGKPVPREKVSLCRYILQLFHTVVQHCYRV
jgi:hypothetical protein